MGKRKGANSRAKRSLSRLPKGLPVRHGGVAMNPFEVNHRLKKRPKFEVLNRNDASSTRPKPASPALAQSLERKRKAIREEFVQSKKANTFHDRRIGEHDDMTPEEQQLARLVRERSRRSKQQAKYSLQDNDDNHDEQEALTHRGQAVDALSTRKGYVVPLDDHDDHDDQAGGNLDAVDTLMHFGGGGGGAGASSSRGNAPPEASIYGPASSSCNKIADVYSRPTELQEWIAHRKQAKMIKMQTKETQVERFQAMDESFAELACMLSFRTGHQDPYNNNNNNNNNSESQSSQQRDDGDKNNATAANTVKETVLDPVMEAEMMEWDRQTKEFLLLDRTQKRVAATDRTKTPQELAQEEADRLHALEQRRLARMHGDFDAHDNFSDLDDDHDDDKKSQDKKKKKRKKNQQSNPEALEESDDNDDDDDDKPKVRFTADGLVKVDGDGNVIEENDENNDDDDDEEEEEEDDDDDDDNQMELVVGTRVNASYRATEQYDGNESWFSGVIAKVNKTATTITYDIEYDDGDFEQGVKPCHVRQVEKTQEQLDKEASKKAQEADLKWKRQRAKEKARTEIPYVLEVPTTLDAFHDLVSQHAQNGKDVSTIIRRIHAAHSVRLDHRNTEKMQNFYDVLVRRFVTVGDAIYKSGHGGSILARYKQLDDLTDILYKMAQDSPECAAAVWSRRLGIWQSAHEKRLRDAQLVDAEATEASDPSHDVDLVQSAWPSLGVILALRALGHIFPVTDKRHCIVTPTLLWLGQMIAQTPVCSRYDLMQGTLCAGLMLEYTREARRVAPEALAWVASLLRLYAPNRWEERESMGKHALPNLGTAVRDKKTGLSTLRQQTSRFTGTEPPKLCMERSALAAGPETGAAFLFSALHMVESSARALSGALDGAEREVFSSINASILALDPKKETEPLPTVLQRKLAKTLDALQDSCGAGRPRVPLQRRAGPTTLERAVPALAPRLENPDTYSMSKSKKNTKSAVQIAADRVRREYKREHKAVSRELRQDASLVEAERREQQEKRDTAARQQRQRAFAWLESEQATMNQQVRQGGGLLKGGGTGVARAKAATAKMGIKKGGKF